MAAVYFSMFVTLDAFTPKVKTKPIPLILFEMFTHTRKAKGCIALKRTIAIRDFNCQRLLQHTYALRLSLAAAYS